MNNLPKIIQKEIKEVVYRKADTHGYMFRDRVTNGKFMESLLKDQDVGKRLEEYMPSEKIKTYIKDAVLNRYAKDMNEIPRDVSLIIKEIFGYTAEEVEHSERTRVSLYRSDTGELVVVGRASYLKWETAVRKALEFAVKIRSNEKSKASIKFLIIISTKAKSLTDPDKVLVQQALRPVNIDCYFFEIGKNHEAVNHRPVAEAVTSEFTEYSGILDSENDPDIKKFLIKVKYLATLKRMIDVMRFCEKLNGVSCYITRENIVYKAGKVFAKVYPQQQQFWVDVRRRGVDDRNKKMRHSNPVYGHVEITNDFDLNEIKRLILASYKSALK